MIRLFNQHEIRKQKELDGIWDVEVKGRRYKLPVPGVWEQHPDLINYKGIATYTKTLELVEKTNIRLEFKGISHTADVFFDGEKICHHYNAYTAFDAIIRDVSEGRHEIKVVVDNSYGPDSALHVPNDYYTYGGFNRTSLVEEIGDCYIKEVHFSSHRVAETGDFKGEINFVIVNVSTTEKSIKIGYELAGQSQEKNVKVAPDCCAEISFEDVFEDVNEWSPANPNLYDLVSTLYEDERHIDDLIDRVGFREVTIVGRDILLNGEKIFMKGFNRHEDYGVLGSAVPFQVMNQDLDMMKEMNANAVRTCHYPNDEIFLDLCDEKGFFVWEESHARGLDLEHMQNPNFDRQSRDCINEMIHQHYNHPSIIIWAILNECASETIEGREKYAMQLSQIRQLDKTRPVTFATCRHFTDICLDLPDIISFNIYSGWYQDISVKERHEQEFTWINEVTDSNRPCIISEFGAGAMYGYRDRGHCKWSEERQADIIRENLEVYEHDDRLSGLFIWQFADCRVDEEKWSSTRVRCHNNKGIVDEYRRPKEAYDTVKEYYGRIGQ